MENRRRRWVWFLFPIFLHVIGGIIAYYAIKPDEPRMARDCLYIGITLTGIQFGGLLIMLAVGFSMDNAFTPGFGNQFGFHI